jgi:hypothetical protein
MSAQRKQRLISIFMVAPPLSVEKQVSGVSQAQTAEDPEENHF